MFFRKSILIHFLRSEVSRLHELIGELRGERDTLRKGYEDMKRIAGDALEAAKVRHFPHRHQSVAERVYLERSQEWAEAVNSLAASDYIAPEVKYCPACNVCVRGTDWPVPCPRVGCEAMIGDILDSQTLQ